MGIRTSNVLWIEDEHEVSVRQGHQMIEIELFEGYRVDYLTIYAKPEKMKELVSKIKEATDGNTGESEACAGDQEEGL